MQHFLALSEACSLKLYLTGECNRENVVPVCILKADAVNRVQWLKRGQLLQSLTQRINHEVLFLASGKKKGGQWKIDLKTITLNDLGIL